MRSFIFMMVALTTQALAEEPSKPHTLQATKEKVCKVVNGKNDCTVQEVKAKALELKKKIPGL